MKLFLYNADGYLRPLYEEDADEKKKLKRGSVYLAEIKEARNVAFNRKFRKLIRLSFEYLPERQREGFHDDPDKWCDYVTVLAGHCEMFYSPQYKIWIQIPASLSFEKMDELEFQEFYDRVYTEIFKIIGPLVSEEEFKENFADF